MQIPFNISVKAATGFVVAAILAGLQAAFSIVDVSPEVLVWITTGVGLLCAWAIPEGSAYVNKWLKAHGIPVDVNVEAAKK